MKLSVSVPDALWQRARGLAPSLNPSHLVQEAVRSWVGEGGRIPAYPLARPPASEADFEAIKARFADEAREEFERGYGAGIETAKDLSWGDVEGLAEFYRFDVGRWARANADEAIEKDRERLPAGPPDDREIERLVEQLSTPRNRRQEEDSRAFDPFARKMSALINALGTMVPPYGDNEPTPSATYLAGFTQAMRDIWIDVTQGGTQVTSDTDDER